MRFNVQREARATLGHRTDLLEAQKGLSIEQAREVLADSVDMLIAREDHPIRAAMFLLDRLPPEQYQNTTWEMHIHSIRDCEHFKPTPVQRVQLKLMTDLMQDVGRTFAIVRSNCIDLLRRSKETMEAHRDMEEIDRLPQRTFTSLLTSAVRQRLVRKGEIPAQRMFDGEKATPEQVGTWMAISKLLPSVAVAILQHLEIPIAGVQEKK